MRMDFQIPVIFVSLFSIASVILVFIFKFAIKEKSYEEALAEQRQNTSILLGNKPKLKEKKNKKLPKKTQTVVKEKVVQEVVEVIEDQEESAQQKKQHVDFKETAEELVSKPVVTNKKPAKKDKVRPILINKEKVENVEKILEKPAPPVNHFEELHPKDEFELRRSNSEQVLKDELAKINNEPKAVQSEIPKPVNKKTEAVNLQSAPLTAAPPLANGYVGNGGKDKKKKKNDFNTLQHFAGSNNGPNISILLDLVRKAELSHSDVQVLIDLLLNKQHESAAVVGDWSEGKSDPVQKLKKQLAEKEKLLAEEQQVLASAQSKLREIRSEHQGEKAQLLQKIRGLEEVLHVKQMEATRSQQQVQQLQAQVKEELLKYHQLREENAALQMQRQQIEIRLKEAQECDVLMTRLQSEAQEYSAVNATLGHELNRLTEENMAEKERNQSFIIQLNNFQKELEQKSERNRQLEEARLQLEHQLDAMLKQEKELKAEKAMLSNALLQKNEEIVRLERTTKQYVDDLQRHQEDSNLEIVQLRGDLRKLEEENKKSHMNGSVQDNKHEVEMLNLHNELSSLKTQLAQSDKDLKAANSTVKKLQEEVEELKNRCKEAVSKLEEQKTKNNELRERNWKVMEALNAAESRVKSNVKSKSDQEIQREFIQRLFPEIKDEKVVNPDLFKVEGEGYLKKYVSSLQQQPRDDDLQQLKMQTQHYKNVIDNTEKMLNKLQEHIEREEINWRTQLSVKNAELETVKQNLKKQLEELETQLAKEKEEKSTLLAQCKTNAQNISQC